MRFSKQVAHVCRIMSLVVGLVVGMIFSVTASPVRAATTTYEYDDCPGSTHSAGRLCKVTESPGNTTTLAYDERGNVTDTTTSIGNNEYLIKKLYDSLNRPVDLTYPDGEMISHTYNSQGLLNQIESTTHGTFYAKEIDYNARDQVTKLVQGNDVTTTYRYGDPSDVFSCKSPRNTCAIKSSRNGTNIQSITYGYDARGNVTRVLNALAQQDMGYDALDRLTSVAYHTVTIITPVTEPVPVTGERIISAERVVNTDCPSCTSTFGYNGIGNMLSWTDGPNTYNFTYPASGAARPHAPTDFFATSLVPISPRPPKAEVPNARSRQHKKPRQRHPGDGSVQADPQELRKDNHLLIVPAWSYAYDENGNLRTRQNGFSPTRLFSWDAENRLLTIEDDSTTVATFSYDYTGQRVTKTVGSTVTTYVEKLHECVENTQGVSCTNFVFGLGRRLAAKSTNSSEIRYYHADHLGSTRLITRENGSEEQRLSYNPFGSLRFNSLLPSSGVAHKFTGQELDEETDLYYYGARYYDAEWTLMRFISPDPLGVDPRNPQTLNRYSYVLNNPLKFTDPTGNKAVGGGTLSPGSRPSFGDLARGGFSGAGNRPPIMLARGPSISPLNFNKLRQKNQSRHNFMNMNNKGRGRGSAPRVGSGKDPILFEGERAPNIGDAIGDLLSVLDPLAELFFWRNSNKG